MKALEDARKNIALNPQDPTAYVDLAQIYLAQAEGKQMPDLWQRAIAAFDVALALDPTCWAALVGVSEAEWQMGNRDAALAYAFRAVKASPRDRGNSIGTKARLVAMLIKLKMWKQATSPFFGMLSTARDRD